MGTSVVYVLIGSGVGGGGGEKEILNYRNEALRVTHHEKWVPIWHQEGLPVEDIATETAAQATPSNLHIENIF